MDFTTFKKIFFKDKHNWKYVTEKEKAGVFFILNRNMARVRPANADALNHKGIETGLATDIWYKVCEQSLDVPNWFNPPFRPKTTATVTKDSLDDMDKLILQKFYAKQIEEEKQKDLDTKKKGDGFIVKKHKKKKGS
jgi:hypothetical protein